MIAKFAIVLSLAAVAYAGLLPATKLVYAEPEAPARYDFSYSVHDSQSGDVKEQQESRNGDAVRGSYSLVQPDGVRRIVEYSADDHQGFNAIVRYEGAPAKIAYSAPVAKVAYAAPIAKFAYSAPVAKFAYAAPVAKAAYATAPASHFAYSSPAISYRH
ncbi:unnamed protein product [Arctia plantaginis]|uniref:Cuticle protein n=1 Tax=Arctia plantaginis TaxID=874455 RepID=A0A8S1ABI3_ARCPL|nr:unnamed protein product [Arctia plantaginis]